MINSNIQFERIGLATEKPDFLTGLPLNISGAITGDSIMKTCSKCKQFKPLSEFHKENKVKDGHRAECKICSSRDDKKYRQTDKGKAVHLKSVKKGYHQTIRGYLKFVFRSMLHRCHNPKDKAYKYYGGRGIKVKFVSFDDFYDYVVNELKANPRGLTIDRINNDGNYERRNIRFITQAENCRNRRKKYQRRPKGK